mmetsp:Transcript_42840/g.99501  ORF Transcript_42840/g.99501 Transcript_42840/m.99501 type:complete len:296 (-) Transcript_42840:284-1171(-)
MGERKVLNKYYPPDFDPELLPRNKKPRDRQIEVRIMIPFTLCCTTCKEFMYRGKKFNSKKEIIQDQTYLGIHMHRFFIKCTRCASEICFRTDPKTADYQMEHGATRNYEIWNDRRQDEEGQVQERLEDEEGDAMKALENRTQDSKVEMDILDALDDSKMLNARKAKLDTSKVIERLRGSRQQEDQNRDSIELDSADEEEVDKTEFASSVKRIAEEEEEKRAEERRKMIEATKAAVVAGKASSSKAAEAKKSAIAGKFTLKRKVETAPPPEEKKEEQQGGLAGLMGYGSGSGSEGD